MKATQMRSGTHYNYNTIVTNTIITNTITTNYAQRHTLQWAATHTVYTIQQDSLNDHATATSSTLTHPPPHNAPQRFSADSLQRMAI